MDWNPVALQFVIFGRFAEVHLFGLVTMAIVCALYPTYIRAMMYGTPTMVNGVRTMVKVSPPCSTWFLWLALDIVAFTASWTDGRFDPLLFAYTAGTLVVSLFTLKYGQKGWTTIETVCAAAVVVAIALWLLIGPAVATVCALGGMTISMMPLFYGVLRKGQHEDERSWLIGVASSASNLIDGQILVSIWIGLLQGALLAAIRYNKHFRKTPAAS